MELREQVIMHITQNQEKFYRLAFGYVHNQDMALDIVQNALVKALTYYPDIRNEKYIRTWFYRILVNECCSFLRKNQKELLYEPEELQKHIEGSKTEVSSDREVLEQVFMLPEEMKTVILLRFYEELSLAEISRVTDVKLSTVKYRLYKALDILKTNIREVEK